VFVPYDCYYHMYNRDDLNRCAAKEGVEWIHAMGDSQEREVIAMLKMINGSNHDATKFEQVCAMMPLSHPPFAAMSVPTTPPCHAPRPFRSHIVTSHSPLGCELRGAVLSG
jgi:hypothetical protein